MTTHVPPLILDDDLLRAIGEVTVEAADLEWCLAYLTELGFDYGDDWLTNCLATPGEARRAFARLVQAVTDGPLRVRLERVQADAFAALDERHRLIHSVAIWTRDEDDGRTTWRFWHPKTDLEHDVTAPALRDLASRLRNLNAGVRALASPVQKRGPGADQT